MDYQQDIHDEEPLSSTSKKWFYFEQLKLCCNLKNYFTWPRNENIEKSNYFVKKSSHTNFILRPYDEHELLIKMRRFVKYRYHSNIDIHIFNNKILLKTTVEKWFYMSKFWRVV